MGISIDSSMASYLTNQASAAKENNAANSVRNTVNNLGQNASEEEMKAAIKDFESYFVEQMLKNVEKEFEDDSATFSGLTNFFMGSVNEKLADQLVDGVGSRFTQTLYEQMCRNYNIPVAGDEIISKATSTEKEPEIEAAKETINVAVKE